MNFKLVPTRQEIRDNRQTAGYDLATIYNALCDLDVLETESKGTHTERNHIAAVRRMWVKKIAEMLKDTTLDESDIPF